MRTKGNKWLRQLISPSNCSSLLSLLLLRFLSWTPSLHLRLLILWCSCKVLQVIKFWFLPPSALAASSFFSDTARNWYCSLVPLQFSTYCTIYYPGFQEDNSKHFPSIYKNCVVKRLLWGCAILLCKILCELLTATYSLLLKAHLSFWLTPTSKKEPLSAHK